MRRVVLIALVVLAGCGSDEPRENLQRPPVPVLMTASVDDQVVRVSPRATGAGPITLVVSNQTSEPQTITFETDEIGGEAGGRRASSPSIPPRGTGRLTIDARTGVYAVRASGDAIQAARVRIGPPRPSGQDRVLLP